MSAVKSSAIFIGLYKKPELKAKVKLHRKLSYESLKMPDRNVAKYDRSLFSYKINRIITIQIDETLAPEWSRNNKISARSDRKRD